MQFSQALRLQELWNGSFGLHLAVRYKLEKGYYLYGTNQDTPVDVRDALIHIVDRLALDLIDDYSYYTIS